MKYLKKISTVVLALMMVLSMGASVFAVENTNQHGNETTANSFKIPKDIVLFNTNGLKIYEPNVTYNYAITAGAPGENTTITDDPAISKYDGNTDKSVTAKVKAGTGGVTLTGTSSTDVKGVGQGNISVVFGDGEHEAAASYDFATNVEGAAVSESSKKATRDITVTINPADDAFKKDGNFVPGVYRYHIAETGSNANENGVKTYDNRLKDITLDVYLKWNANKDGLEVYGYVLSRDLTESENLKYDTAETPSMAKITGFDIPSNLVDGTGAATTSTADEYHTFNTTVTKTVDGALADKNNTWPFQIDVTGISSTEFYYQINEVTATGDLRTMGSGQTISNDNTKLKHGDKGIRVVGLPYNATVTVTETNNTSDTYTPSATYKAGSADAADITSELNIVGDFAPTKTAATLAYKNGKAASAKTLTDALTEDVIAFTNTLAAISPTNVVMRYAPYLFILGGAVMMLMISRRRKAEQE